MSLIDELRDSIRAIPEDVLRKLEQDTDLEDGWRLSGLESAAHPSPVAETDLPSVAAAAQPDLQAEVAESSIAEVLRQVEEDWQRLIVPALADQAAQPDAPTEQTFPETTALDVSETDVADSSIAEVEEDWQRLIVPALADQAAQPDARTEHSFPETAALDVSETEVALAAAAVIKPLPPFEERFPDATSLDSEQQDVSSTPQDEWERFLDQVVDDAKEAQRPEEEWERFLDRVLDDVAEAQRVEERPVPAAATGVDGEPLDESGAAEQPGNGQERDVFGAGHHRPWPLYTAPSVDRGDKYPSEEKADVEEEGGGSIDFSDSSGGEQITVIFLEEIRDELRELVAQGAERARSALSQVDRSPAPVPTPRDWRGENWERALNAPPQRKPAGSPSL